MADSEKSVRTRLVGHAGLSALVGDRVYMGTLPDDPRFPVVLVQEISGIPEPVMGNDTGIVRGRAQVDAWGWTRQEAKDAGEQIRDALQRHNGTYEGSEITVTEMNSGGVRWESDGRVWRHRQDFELYWTETV